jgi:hypothetical protein
METTEVLKVPLDVTWTFDYQIDMEKLKNLYSKAKQSQWDAETYVDWERPIDPSKPLIDEERFGFSRVPLYAKLSDSQREKFRAHMTAQILSGILHGEQGALMTAAVLTHAVPDYEGKLYAATQTMDEARHVEVYDRYIQRLAIIYPMSSGLKSLIEMAFKGDHWVKVAIGMNMVVESLALGAFHNMAAATTCDTLRTILQMVLRDESRHVAFGHVYVKEAIGRMTTDEREDIAEFTFEAVSRQRRRGGVASGDSRFIQVLINAGIDPQDFLRSMAEARQQGLLKGAAAPGQVHMFRDLMMPALVRVGAITERTRAKFAEQGIQIFEDTTVLEAMEDDTTGEFDVAVAAEASKGDAERDDAPSGY